MEADRYVKERSLVIGAAAKMMAYGGGNLFNARQASHEVYGENHPVTRALVASTGPAGGFIVPPDYMNEVIELLRPAAVVRGSNPRVIPMPRGTMTLPGQASPATASYGTESSQIATSQQTLKSDRRQLQEIDGSGADFERSDALRRSGDRRHGARRSGRSDRAA